MAKGFSAVRDEQYSNEIESLLQKTEFDSKQLLKNIENEKKEIAEIKKELELKPKQIKKVEMDTRRCEEEVKRLHGQLTQNAVLTESMKKQGIRLDDEIEILRNKLEGLVKTTAERAVEYNEKLENYKAIWKNYEQKYTSSPKAQELKKLQQTVDELKAKKSELVQTREILERKLSHLTSSSKETKAQKPRWTDWFIKLASTKMETMKLQNESAELHQAKLKALEENKFLQQKLELLKAKQFMKQSTLQVDKVTYETPQEQYDDQTDNEPASDMVEMVPEDTDSFLMQDQQLSIENASSQSSQQIQQIPQFAFHDDTTTNSDSNVVTTFVVTENNLNEPITSQGGFSFSGFGEDVNTPQQGISTGLQLASEPNSNSVFGNFSFTSPGMNEEGATGMSCFGSPVSVSSVGQENFSFLFSAQQTPTNNPKNVFNF